MLLGPTSSPVVVFVGCSGGLAVDFVGYSGYISIEWAPRRMQRLTFSLVLGGTGFVDDVVGLGVAVGFEPSSHLPPIHVMMYV